MHLTLFQYYGNSGCNPGKTSGKRTGQSKFTQKGRDCCCSTRLRILQEHDWATKAFLEGDDVGSKEGRFGQQEYSCSPGLSHVQFLSYAYGLDVVQCIRIVHSFRIRTSKTPTRVDNRCPWRSLCRSNAAYQIPSCPSTGTCRKTRNSRPLFSKTSRSRSY